MENELDVRIQHAVEHDEIIEGVTVQKPALLSVPKDGEIVFNRDRKDFKVGDGSTAYTNLPNILHKPCYIFSGSLTEDSSLLTTGIDKVIDDCFFAENATRNIKDYSGIIITVDPTIVTYYSLFSAYTIASHLNYGESFDIYLHSGIVDNAITWIGVKTSVSTNVIYDGVWAYSDAAAAMLARKYFSDLYNPSTSTHTYIIDIKITIKNLAGAYYSLAANTVSI